MIHEIPLEAGAQGILLTVCGSRTCSRTADGRRPVENLTNYFGVAVSQVRASSGSSGLSRSPPSMPASRMLECDELTVLTGWAEAVAEALACAPERVDGVLAYAHEGGSWRADLGIAEPSPQLSKAIDVIGRAVRSATSKGRAPNFDALLVSSQEDQRGEDGLDRLAHQVLRTTLEQLGARQAAEERGMNVE